MCDNSCVQLGCGQGKAVKHATFLKTNERSHSKGHVSGHVSVHHVLSACCCAALGALSVMVHLVTRKTIAYCLRKRKSADGLSLVLTVSLAGKVHKKASQSAAWEKDARRASEYSNASSSCVT